jgi:hypothetical protein
MCTSYTYLHGIYNICDIWDHLIEKQVTLHVSECITTLQNIAISIQKSVAMISL